MGEHTKEPWSWKAYSNDIEGGEHGYTEIMSPEVECGPWCYGGRVSLNISDEDKARIVACVNACAGIPTADLAEPVYPAEVVRRLVEAGRRISDYAADPALCADTDGMLRELRTALADVGRAGRCR